MNPIKKFRAGYMCLAGIWSKSQSSIKGCLRLGYSGCCMIDASEEVLLIVRK